MRPFIAVVLVLLCAWFCAPIHAAQVRAKVVAPDGQPVAGAAVWAGEMGRLEYSEKDGTLRQLTTGADGTFAFDIADTAPAAFARIIAPAFALNDTALKAGDNTVQLKLIKGLHGTVKDAKGEPVADAVVQLIFAPGDEKSFGQGMETPVNMLSFLKWTAALTPVETRSDAAGKWAINGVNSGIVALKDPRFAPSTGFAGLGGPSDGKPVALIAKQGADIKGKLLTPDGKPLPGVYVLSGDFFGSQLPRTNAEGAFTLVNVGIPTIPNMPNAPMALMGISLDNDWIVPPLMIQKPLTLGQMNEAPEWKATRGVEITGQLVDAKTKMPIANAKINSSMGQSKTSDAEGRFRIRVAPPQTFMSVSHPDHVPFWKQVELPPAATTFDMGRVALTRALTLQGRLVDEKGAPVKDYAFTASYPNDDTGQRGERAVTGADGTFKVQVPAGAVTLSFAEDYEAISETATKIEFNEKTAPIEIKVRKLAQHQIKGRVVTPAGKAVSGANVTISVSRLAKTKGERTQGTITEGKNATTDAEGRFSVAFNGSINLPTVTKVEAEGYFFRKGSPGVDGKNIKTNDWPLPDTIVVEMISIVSGRVLGPDGAPAANALISSPDAAKFVTAKADATGRFTLKNLPEGEVSLLTAHGKSFARVVAKTGVESEIQLMQPGVLVPSMQRQFFAQLIKDPFSSLHNYWDFIGTENLLALALQKDGALPPGELDSIKADWSKAGSATFTFLSESARRDPTWLLQNGAVLLKNAPHPEDGQERFNAEAAFASVAALKGDEAARGVAAAWLTFAAAQKDKPNQNVENATRLFRLAAIAKALGQKNADGLLLAALTLADQAGKKTIVENASNWGAALAIGGPEAFGRLDEEWPIEARVNALSGSIRHIAPLDLSRAKLLLDKLQTLRDDPAFKKQLENAGQEGQRMPQQIAGAETIWRRAQIETDLEAGVKWIEAQPGFDLNSRSQAARVAWQQKKFDIAARLMRPALEQAYAPNGDIAYLATLARDFDKDLSEKLFAKSEELAAAQTYPNAESAAGYGFYRAQENPALARLWLENSWLNSKNLPKENQWMISASQNNLGAAMVALDAVRGLEMLADAPSDYNRTQARARIAAYLLADEAQRAILRAEND